METECLYDAVNLILSFQSISGGFPAWELQRAFRWLEIIKIQPHRVLCIEDTLIEREYVECTSSAVQGLALFRKLYPNHRRKEIDSCISKAIRYIEQAQSPSLMVYGNKRCVSSNSNPRRVFRHRALAACEKNYRNSPVLRKACALLLSKQLPDGGWGEGYLSSRNKVYTNLDGNRFNLVNTAWALLSLIEAGQDDIDPTYIHRGIRVLINSQMEDGDFPQQEITGVYMRNCTLNYSYRNIFPIWALGKYLRCI